MEATLTAVEVVGTVNEHHRLELDEALPMAGPMRVRVIVLYPQVDVIGEDDWLLSAARNPAFRDLADPEEDIYTEADGELFRDSV